MRNKTYYSIVIAFFLQMSVGLQGSPCTFRQEKDTTKRKRIEYEDITYTYPVRSIDGKTVQRTKRRAIYYFEGDSLDKKITARNLIKDLRDFPEIRKKIKRERRVAFWIRTLGIVLLGGLTTLCIFAFIVPWRGRLLFGFFGLQTLVICGRFVERIGNHDYLYPLIEEYNSNIK